MFCNSSSCTTSSSASLKSRMMNDSCCFPLLPLVTIVLRPIIGSRTPMTWYKGVRPFSEMNLIELPLSLATLNPSEASVILRPAPAPIPAFAFNYSLPLLLVDIMMVAPSVLTNWVITTQSLSQVPFSYFSRICFSMSPMLMI